MKSIKLLLLIISLCFTGLAYSQDYVKKKDTAATGPDPNSIPKAYLGFGTGLNNYVGLLGFGADVRLHNTLFLRVGTGIGTWGYKITGALRYALQYGKGWALELGYSYCTGLKHFMINLQVDSAGYTPTQQVSIYLMPVSTINFIVSHYWVFHKKNNFYINMGYSVPLQQDPFVLNTSGVELTSTSARVIKRTSPGGLSLSLGLMFGIF
jgi:hypothetical protein